MDKYEEALKRARELYDAGNFLTKQQMGIVFPELAESEDERIRKTLYDEIKNWDASYRMFKTYSKESFLAYLEKQKEPHYTKRNALFDKCVENCDPEVMKEVSDKVDEMLGKEQKPAEIDVKALLTADRLASAEMTGRLKERSEILENPEKYGLCKPAEWSEEDRQIARKINDVILGDLKLEIGYLTNEEREKMSDWFTSMFYSHPRSSDNWKPSDEQMIALYNMIPFVKSVGGPSEAVKPLESLYEDLKKL